MLNEVIYTFAVWLDSMALSTQLHESFYLYNWIEATHVLTLMVSLGMLFLIDLRILGYVLPGVPAEKIASHLNVPMLIGFTIMIITGLLLFYAIPVRSSQSLWLRIKVVLLVAAAINAFIFHKKLTQASTSWNVNERAPKSLRVGAMLSIFFWILIAMCGRFIAYDWFDCSHNQGPIISTIVGCIEGQTSF